jgi:hypothetical protein
MNLVFQPMWAVFEGDMEAPLDVRFCASREDADELAARTKSGKVYGPLRVEYPDVGGLILSDFKQFQPELMMDAIPPTLAAAAPVVSQTSSS